MFTMPEKMLVNLVILHLQVGAPFPGCSGVTLQAALGFVQPVLAQKGVLQLFSHFANHAFGPRPISVFKSVATLQDMCLFERSAFTELLLSWLFTGL